MSAEKLVSVVIPAYNAEATLDETLRSVRAQTHRALEIVVVDDGSTDSTAALAGAHAAEDPRVRVLSVANGGVAAARNAGIAVSRGAFVAPVDADDLWHPEKIARQLAVIERDPEIGYVYTFFRRIDSRGDVLSISGEGTWIEGAAYLRSLLCNFVNNGSSLLIRRAALDEVGGYEPGLRGQGAQGCEDYLLQILIARTWRVACVPECLTGYRYGETGMSTDWERMARSHRVMLEYVVRRYPETPPDVVAASEAVSHAFLAVRRLRRLRPLGAAAELGRGLRRDAGVAALMAAGYGWISLRGTVARRLARAGGSTGRVLHFLDLDPAEEALRPGRPLSAGQAAMVDPSCDLPSRHPQPLARQLRALADREEAFFATRPGSAAPEQGRGRKAGGAALPVHDGAPEAAGSL
jgi:hypothetical protein